VFHGKLAAVGNKMMINRLGRLSFFFDGEGRGILKGAFTEMAALPPSHTERSWKMRSGWFAFQAGFSET
jgi:hypothetical protein